MNWKEQVRKEIGISTLKVVNNYELLHLDTYTGVTYFHVIVVTQKQSEEFLKL